ncbi:MAG: hypothetical protein WC389_14950 [Lutibacter sp.]|jgi:hypothetical protein
MSNKSNIIVQTSDLYVSPIRRLRKPKKVEIVQIIIDKPDNKIDIEAFEDLCQKQRRENSLIWIRSNNKIIFKNTFEELIKKLK